MPPSSVTPAVKLILEVDEKSKNLTAQELNYFRSYILSGVGEEVNIEVILGKVERGNNFKVRRSIVNE